MLHAKVAMLTIRLGSLYMNAMDKGITQLAIIAN